MTAFGDHTIRRGLLAAWLSLQAAGGAFAHTIDVAVVDPDGEPVADVAVFATYEAVQHRRPAGSAIMDQVDKRFVPHVLVVQRGTAVDFPNSDVVAHHVYSFSRPNDFVLPLYKGDQHDPITFVHDGVVTLGCNIHDDMLAYIVVVDTDVFGKTDANGRISLDIGDGAANIVVHAWSPRIRDEELTRAVETATSTVVFNLEKKLRPPHDAGSEAIQWSEY